MAIRKPYELPLPEHQRIAKELRRIWEFAVNLEGQMSQAYSKKSPECQDAATIHRVIERLQSNLDNNWITKLHTNIRA